MSISNFELKFKLIREYVHKNGINDPLIKSDWDAVKYDSQNKPIESSIGRYLKGLMLITLNRHCDPIIDVEEQITEYQSLTQKSFYFDQSNIETESDFEDFFAENSESSTLVFRGQREAKWRLYNSLQRTWILKQLYKSEKSYFELISKLVSYGKKVHESYIKSVLKSFHVDTINDISVLGFLQHHECPTPLLDWTNSLENALYFGIDGLAQNENGVFEIDDYFTIYSCPKKELTDYKRFWNEIINDFDQKLLSDFIEFIAKDDHDKELRMKSHFKGRNLIIKENITGSGLVSKMLDVEFLEPFHAVLFSDDDKDSGIVFSLHNNKNILNQKGGFTWNNSAFKPLESIGREYYQIQNPDDDVIENYRFCKCININKRLAPFISEKLNSLGIVKDFIYVSNDTNAFEIFTTSLSK
ncbi:MAG: FRG domain-containing protein [Saprospiraceae bacterium]|nr:FRG domain-containing protein [Saprospiraceae bacterium]